MKTLSSILPAVAISGMILLTSCARQQVGSQVRAITYVSQEPSRFVALSLFDLPHQPQVVAMQISKDHRGETKRPISRAQFERIWSDLEASHLEPYKNRKSEKFEAQSNYAVSFGLSEMPPVNGPSLPIYVVPKNKAPQPLKHAVHGIQALNPL